MLFEASTPLTWLTDDEVTWRGRKSMGCESDSPPSALASSLLSLVDESSDSGEDDGAELLDDSDGAFSEYLSVWHAETMCCLGSALALAVLGLGAAAVNTSSLSLRPSPMRFAGLAGLSSSELEEGWCALPELPSLSSFVVRWLSEPPAPAVPSLCSPSASPFWSQGITVSLAARPVVASSVLCCRRSGKATVWARFPPLAFVISASVLAEKERGGRGAAVEGDDEGGEAEGGPRVMLASCLWLVSGTGFRMERGPLECLLLLGDENLELGGATRCIRSERELLPVVVLSSPLAR